MEKPNYKDICKDCGHSISTGDCDAFGCGGQGVLVDEAGIKKRKKLKKESKR